MMDDDRDSLTSTTLLARLRCQPTDQAAWGEFVERYSRKIYFWCRRWDLQPADAEDVTQDVLLKLADKMQAFAYDPAGSFRGWLHTVTRHAWSDFVENRIDLHPVNDVALLTTLPAREDLIEHLREEFDTELLEEAMARVRFRVKPRTWEAFRLLKVEGRPGAEIAEILNMKVATVFVLAGKVLRKLQIEIRRLEKPGPE